MARETITIGRRFRGPLTSANGGYCAGLLARAIQGSVEVTLRIPPPLERPLDVRSEGDRVLLLDGERLVAEARALGPELDCPEPPSFEAALAASRESQGWLDPEFAECFVCGDRDDGSGLAIHAGRIDGRQGLVAAAWVAKEVASEIVWAAIDCPGAYAVGGPGREDVLLGRMTARIDRLPDEGEPCVVVGWPLGVDRRKLFAGTALYGEDGVPIARSRQVWFVPTKRIEPEGG
jgi:hypothetical protein